MKKIYSAPTMDVKCYNSITKVNSNINLISNGQTKAVFEGTGIELIGDYTIDQLNS